jgi:peptide/nickel transport system substrate-binding protein
MLPRLIFAFITVLLTCVTPAKADPVHAIALYGEPREPPGFTHFSYVNPEALKGGRLVLGAFGSYDSLNPLIVKGVAANGIRDFTIAG